ncbi:sulfite exporter TauE/SafE family protein [Pseudoalteromonas sp. SSM20]|uniref:sulfite exporter TauE/SafE family protein n=1 Tax=Pseudoalteromonas sp. SSM20 TaxID=3139394 RepID=UPI003BAA5520
MTTSQLLSALIMGLLGSGHCLAMCGGVASSLTLAVKDKALVKRYTLLYNLGRILSYCLAGALAAGISQQFASRSTTFSFVLSILSGVFMILVGLYIMRLTFSLNWIEKVGKYAIWQHLVKFNKRLLPVNTNHKALAYGMLWGWLPCGLVYSALLFSISTQSAIYGATFMLLFALGTLPAMVGLAFAADKFKQILNHNFVRMMFGNIFIFYGLYLLIIALL